MRRSVPRPTIPFRSNWYDAVLFCNWLSRQEGLTACYERTGEKEKIRRNQNVEHDAWQLVPKANGYRLPTEAEWEYACRARTVTTFAHGNDESLLDRYAVYLSSRTELPGSKLPNAWGLFDMHGNLREWCQDGFQAYGYGGDEAVTDPMRPPQGGGRVLRGGSFNSYSHAALSAVRYIYAPDRRNDLPFGFRVARTFTP